MNNITLQQCIDFQQQILPKVSRSFALTIPELPEPIRLAVANCYLWCRITDTIEDDPQLTVTQKLNFHQQLIAILADQKQSLAAEPTTTTQFTQSLLSSLYNNTPDAERTLIANTDLVLTITRHLPDKQQELITQCVTKMNQLMPQFEQLANLNGLTNLQNFDQYCYAVAGVVGEMLTGIFCDYCNLPK